MSFRFIHPFANLASAPPTISATRVSIARKSRGSFLSLAEDAKDVRDANDEEAPHDNGIKLAIHDSPGAFSRMSRGALDLPRSRGPLKTFRPEYSLSV